jgi:hypothetical protein
MPLPLRFFVAFLIVLGLIGVTAWVVRRFGAERLGAAAARGRQPRLAVIDAATVDGRRRLVLIRRDNIEHLLMIGGPTDVVIEANIVRAAAAARDASAPARPPAAGDTLPRAVPLGDSALWPLQPEGAAAARAPRVSTPPPFPAAEEPAQASEESEPPPPAPRRQMRPPDSLAGLAAELSRLPEGPRAPAPDLSSAFAPREPARPREPGRREPRLEREPQREREPLREREGAPMRERETPFEPEPMRAREPLRERQLPIEREGTREREPVQGREPSPMREPILPSGSEPQIDAEADQNLADMAQRLEAALRRPAKVSDARPSDPASRAMAAELDAARAAQSQGRAGAAAESSAAPGDPRSAPKSVYDSLEKEMASLLGRPSGKP